MEREQACGLLINGAWVHTEDNFEVRDKYSGEVLARVSQAGEEEVRAAVTAAKAALAHPMTPQQRYEILMKLKDLLFENRRELGELIAAEAGKPLKDALAEVGRAAETIRLSAEEALRITGETVPVEGFPGSENRLAFTIRVPVGVVCAISPFNYPLNLVCHKVGPALAAGNAVVLKPASTTPLSAIRLCELTQQAGLPDGWLNVVVGPGWTVGEALLANDDINYYTFTGSYAVGKRLKERAGMRKVTLELGSNSGTIVHKDADLELAARQCARMAFANAGQICISVQRVLVHEQIFDAFTRELTAHTQRLVVGDPREMTTDVGPVICEQEAERIIQWVQEAVEQGAKLLTGGNRQGALVQPTVLADVGATMRVWCQEIFGPVVTLMPYQTIQEAIDKINDSEYGLQAGIFTNAMDVALECAKKIKVGGIIINDTSTYRADNMPYGGVKNSGTGKEGPAYAVREMTESRIVVFNHRPPQGE
ncbi:aldehyde dehydrogenase family protein [Heliobacterium chlorum]|uniref:Aldehyde dehydrogenase family protein n=1 Tax=Heliobacterium chlorum TaxID=2698 RepID=A0ABR7T4K8_HELCL|nr:aldehyde dehydrogenase family protein [Heliobacterium chlorum]MBC9785719.1 aldehyde dehydrogenase family protein [Heliobacterium chlorum]